MAADHRTISPRRPSPPPDAFHPQDAESARSADGVFLAFDPDGEWFPDRNARGRPARAAAAKSLARLLAPLGPSVRFQPCRAYPGNPWQRAAAFDTVVFGEGDPGERAGAPAAFDAAWQYARKHGRGVTLVVDRRRAPGEAAATPDRLAAARAIARDFPQIAYEEADGAELLASESFAARASRDIFIASGSAGGRFAARVADQVGGAGFVPSARFGGETAIVESGLAGSRRGPAAARHAPIAALLGAALLCEWLGETGRGARIERAVAAAIADGLPEFRDRTAAARARRAADAAEAIAQRVTPQSTRSAGARSPA